MLKVLSYPAAVAAVQHRFESMLVSTTTDTMSAVGFICASDVLSPETVPAFDRSTVDGYAVACADTNAASASAPAVFELCGEVKMGERADFVVGGGRCVYVPTGGMLPKGADAVAMIEDCERRGDEILLSTLELLRFTGLPLRISQMMAPRATLEHW